MANADVLKFDTFSKNQAHYVLSSLRESPVRFTNEADGQIVVVLPYCHKDAAQAVRTLDWISELGCSRGHNCLLIADNRVDAETVAKIDALADQCFREVRRITTQPILNQLVHPVAAGGMFILALKALGESPAPFLWFEPDCFAGCTNWLDKFDAEYAASGKRHLGMAVHVPDGHPRHYNGTSIYGPGSVHEFLPVILERPFDAFDVVIGDVMRPQTEPSNLFLFKQRVVWDGTKFAEPIFPAFRFGTFALGHDCKDGSTIDAMRRSTRATTVYAYFDRCAGIETGKELEMAGLWFEAWKAAGFEPRILSRADAFRHPRYAELLEITRQRPSVCPRDYVEAVAVRWAAVAAVMEDVPTILMDYDVLPCGLQPRDTSHYTRPTVLAKGICLSAMYLPDRAGANEVVDVLCRPSEPIDGEAKDQEVVARHWDSLDWHLDRDIEHVYGEGTGGEKMIHFPTRVVPEGMRKVDMVRFWLANHVLPNRQPQDARRRAPSGGDDLADV